MMNFMVKISFALLVDVFDITEISKGNYNDSSVNISTPQHVMQSDMLFSVFIKKCLKVNAFQISFTVHNFRTLHSTEPVLLSLHKFIQLPC